jgi:hypothetical protein
MSIIRSATAVLGGAALSLGLAGVSSVASAADLPVKAVPVASPWVLDVHGYADVTFANTRVTNGGLYLYSRGYLTQVDTGLALDIYKNPTGFINSFSVFGGVWNEFWDSPPVGGRVWQEMDMWIGFSVGFAKYWKFTAQHVQFHFPSAIPTAYNYDFKLSYDDSWTGFPIAFNPYIDVFYNASGGSTVVLGKTGSTYRVSIGVVPTVSFMKSAGIPLTVSFPTWVTVGPSEFWNRQDGTTNFCGATTSSPCSSNSTGYYSTGLQARLGLESFIPKRLGSWYVKGGVQYYHLVNDSLLAAQTLVGSAATFPTAKRDIVVGNVGVGFAF